MNPLAKKRRSYDINFLQAVLVLKHFMSKKSAWYLRS